MLEIFLKTFIEFFDKSLSAVLIGATGLLIVLFNYWKVPEKYKEFKKLQDDIAKKLEELTQNLEVQNQVLRRILDQIKFLNKQDVEE